MKIELRLPDKYQNQLPILRLYKLGNINQLNGARLIYPNGSFFIMRKNYDGSYNWIELTKIKPEGMQLIKKTIEEDFFSIESNPSYNQSEHLLCWEAYLNAHEKQVVVPSDLYVNLPDAFEKIELLINQHMYRVNEPIAK